MVLARRLFLVAAMFALPAVVHAQSKKSAPLKVPPRRPAAAASELAVDVVRLTSGKSIRGVFVAANPTTLTLFVSRDWLRRANPELLEKAELEESAARTRALEQLRDRIKKELVGAPAESELRGFLNSEQTRVDELLAKGDQFERPEFLWLDIPKKQIAKLTTTSAERHKVAAWAWYEKLTDVETRDADDLAKELQQRKIDPKQDPPDMSDRLSPRVQDEREWSARMALVAHSFDKPLSFQGTGKTVIRTDNAKNGANMASLIPELLGGQVDTLLKDLLDPGQPARSAAADDKLGPAIKVAEKENARGFRITRVEIDPSGRRSTVSSVFAARMDNGKWEEIWREQVTEDGNKARGSIEKTINDDPQVQSALSVLKTLGVGGEEQVQQAVRVGAATMAAQQAIDGRFTLFQQSFTKRLDGPPLRWTQ